MKWLGHVQLTDHSRLYKMMIETHLVGEEKEAGEDWLAVRCRERSSEYVEGWRGWPRQISGFGGDQKRCPVEHSPV